MSRIFKERYTLPDLLASIEMKQDRLKEIDAESQALREEIVLLSDELMRRSVNKVFTSSTSK